MNDNNKIVLANIAVLGVIIGVPAFLQYRFNKALLKSYENMNKPVPIVGQDYVRIHQSLMNNPGVKEASEVIDRFLTRPEEFNL